MDIVKLFVPEQTVVSFEIFPPKPECPIETIFATLDELKELAPDFISVTYGAGGSSSARSIEIAAKVRNDYGLKTLAHLTCVGAARQEINSVLDRLAECGVGSILALRGDAPQGQERFVAEDGGFAYASDLVSHIKQRGGFSVAAACYPEGHAECSCRDKDLLHLKQKVDAGTDFLITQLFFDNDIYYRFYEKARTVGIACPIAVGVMPVLNANQAKRITSLCGAAIPAKLVRLMDKYGHNPEEMEKAGIDYACEQIVDLAEHKVQGIHLYTMNKPKQSRTIMEQTGLRR